MVPFPFGHHCYFKVTLNRAWLMEDALSCPTEPARVDPGTYYVQRIQSPTGGREDWLVLKGTLTGMTWGRWLEWQNPDYGRYQIDLLPVDPNETTGWLEPTLRKLQLEEMTEVSAIARELLIERSEEVGPRGA